MTKKSQNPKGLNANRMYRARYRQKASGIELVEVGRNELQQFRKHGRIPLDVYREIMQDEADWAEEQMEGAR